MRVVPPGTCSLSLSLGSSTRVTSCSGGAPELTVFFNVGLYGDRTYTRPGGLARGRAYTYGRELRTSGVLARGPHRQQPARLALRRRGTARF